MLKIGLSLSFCIGDLCNDIVNESDVACIITNTCALTEMEWSILIYNYQQTYWRKFPEQAKMFVERLRKTDRIIQPRLLGQPSHSITNRGNWIDL